jgi:tetratricopeptide (TPR) repeat protein
MPQGASALSNDELSWEAIVAGALKVLAWDPENPHTDYYRRFILAVKPEIRQEFTHLGILKARDGDAELAIEIFRALESLFPDDAATLLNLALVYEERARQHEKRENETAAEEYLGLAFEAYKGALAADPSEPTIHYNLAYFYLHQRSFEKAKEHLQVFVRESTLGQKAAREKAPGESAVMTGTNEKRLAEANRIISEIDRQGLIDGLFQKAFDSIRMGKEKEGIGFIKEFIASRPDFQNAWFLLGWGHRRLGEYALGKEAFLKALSVGAPHADLLNELAICLMELGELAESQKRLLEALTLEPENTKVISNLGIVALKASNRKDALGFFRTVLEIDPEDRIAVRYLESLLEKKEKKA